MVATRAGDRPANDLRADELTLFDNGVRQTIASFEKLGSRSNAPSPAAPASSSSQSKAQPRLTVIVLDALNTYWGDQIYGREGVSQMLAKLPPGDYISIFALGDTLHQLHGISGDYASLRAAVEAYEGEQPQHWVGDRAFGLGEEQRNRILDTLDALKGITRMVARNPGWKNLLWVSDAFPLQSPVGRGPALPTFMHKEGAEAMHELAAANVVLYPVSPAGLTAQAGGQWADAMMELAEPTGGKAFFGNNDIGALLRAAIDDSRESYVVTYAPANYREDGSYHEVKMKTSRKGVQLRYRPGYYANPPAR